MIYYIIYEIIEIKKNYFFNYFFNIWNIVESINLLLFVSVISIFLYWKYNINKKTYFYNLVQNNNSFDHYYYSYLFYQIGILSATCTLVGFIKIFKYLRLNKRMKILWDTLNTAMYDLFYMMVVSFLIVSGFAVSGNLIFGQNLSEFKTVSSSISTLLRSLLGDFDYKKMVELCPNIAPIFFVLYIFIVFFVITNMFVAVVCEYFQKIKEMTKNEKDIKKNIIVTNFKEYLYIYLFHESIFRCLNCSKNKKLENDRNKIKMKRFSLTRNSTFKDLWDHNNMSNTEDNKKTLFKKIFPNWKTMNNRYKISCLINKIKFKDSSFKKFFEIFENNKNKNINLNLDELTNLTNDNNISNQIINIYNNHLVIYN